MPAPLPSDAGKAAIPQANERSADVQFLLLGTLKTANGYDAQ